MTHDEQVPGSNGLPPRHIEPGHLESEYREIDALLDGEVVDRNALRSALDDTAARNYFVDALMLRQLTRDMEPTRVVAAGMPRGPFVRGVRWLAAAVILVVGLSSGYVYGQRSHGPVPSSGSVEVILDNTPAPPAPEPTRLIHFEPGVNWTSDTRSH